MAETRKEMLPLGLSSSVSFDRNVTKSFDDRVPNCFDENATASFDDDVPNWPRDWKAYVALFGGICQMFVSW